MSSVVLAFPVDANGVADPQPASQVFAFLPIRQFGFKFSIQADFILSSSREDIHTDRAWNKRLRNAISVAFKHSVEQFKKSDALAFSYLKFVPSESEVLDPFFKPVVAQAIDLLREAQCLPAASGAWKLPRELRYADKRFRELFLSEVALELFGFDYIDLRVQADNELLKKLGCKPVTVMDCFAVFTEHGDWLRQQPLEWKARLYAYLAEEDPQTCIKHGLAKIPCVPTNAGEFVAPEKFSVFYPLSRGKKYGFESELTIIDSELLDKAATHSSRVNDLFAALMVKTDDPYDLVMSHILPRHKGEAWKHSSHKALVGHLRYIKDKLSQYLEGARLAGKTELQAVEDIREGIWVGTKHKLDGAWHFNRAKNLYFSKEYMSNFCIETLLGENIEETSLVSPEYLASRVKDAGAEVESWRTILSQIGVRVAPKLTALANGDWQCSAELQRLLDAPQSSVRKATLECLDQHWAEYTVHLSYVARVGRSESVRETKFAIALRSMSAPTRRRANIPISQSYYPTRDLKELFGDRPAYVDAEIVNEALLDACRITYRIDARACIKRLQQLKVEGGDTTPQLHAIYRHIERFWGKEGAFIKQAFAQEGLIRVKGTHAVWARPDEVTWRSNSPFLDSLYAPLQGQYRDFSAFFNDKLGIPKDLPTAKRVQALSRLDEVESPEERVSEANAIYQRANRDLYPRFGRDEVPSPAWLEVFESEEVFLNRRGELVANDESLFANDCPKLAKLFSDDEDISLLAIPFENIPRVGRLLRATQVQLLSTSVEVEVFEASGGQVLSGLTTRVRQVVPFIARVIYAKNHEKFEKALTEGLFARLLGIEVIEVPQLKLKATLAGVTREMSADVATRDNQIILKTGARSAKNRVASELCQFLGVSEDLADTVAMVLMAEDAEGIEDFLNIRRIGPLPADIQASLTGDSWPQSTREVSDGEPEELQPAVCLEDAEGSEIGAESGPPEVSVQAEPAGVAGSGLGEAPVSGHPVMPVNSGGGLSYAHLSRQMRGTGEAQTGYQAPPLSSEPKQDSRSLETPHAPTGKAKSEPTRLLEAGSHTPGPTPSNTGSGDTAIMSGGESEPKTQEPPRRPSHLGEFGKPSAWPKSPRSRRTRGRSQQKRTKSGRLMSYAASFEEAQREWNADNAEEAAARDAIGQAAVDYFVVTQSGRWKSLTPMPHNNPGFDVKAVAYDGTEEVIEVKGRSAAWTEDGVALTPTELMAARSWGERYWLCVVEFAQDEKRRALYLLKNPYGLTNQFRFDSGWKSATIISEAAIPLKPDAGLFIEIPRDGRGRIFSSRKKGQFFKLHIIFDDGRQVHRTFNPATMKLSAE